LNESASHASIILSTGQDICAKLFRCRSECRPLLLGSLVGHIWTGYLIPNFWMAALVGSYAVPAAASLASTLRGIAFPVRLLISLYKLLTGIARAVVSVFFSNRLCETVRAAALATSGA
jgi:hypothetical protein